MSKQGFISLHRKLMDNPVWSDPNYLKLWVYCLFKASHKEHEQLVGNQLVKLERGQFPTGRFSLAEDMNKGVKPKQRVNELTWWRYLNNLEKFGMLNIKTTNKFSVVTIVNYEVYQDWNNKVEQQTEQQLNNKRTTVEQQLNTNNNVNKGNKENKKSSSNAASVSEVHCFYQDNLQKGLTESPFILENIDHWINDLSPEIVLEAMKRSAIDEKKGFKYTEGILKSWASQKVKTLEDVERIESEYAQNRQGTSATSRTSGTVYKEPKPRLGKAVFRDI